MTPKVAVDIVSRDKSDAGFRAVERRAQSFSRKTKEVSRESGLDRLGRQIDGLNRFRALSFGFDAAGRSLSGVSAIAKDTSGAVAGMTRNVLTFGGAAPRAFQAAAAGAATAAGAVAAATAAVVGLGVATYMLGDKWAKIGAGVGRRAEDLGLSAEALQKRRAAAERFGVAPDQTDSAFEGLGDTLYDAKYGANNLALGVMNQLGLKMKEKADGSIDTEAMMDDLADAIAKQKNPQVQRKLAAVFGVSDMLPALRKGSGALKAEGDDYMKSGAALSDAEIAKAKEAERQGVRLKQQLGAVEKGFGVAAMGTVGPISEKTVAGLRGGAIKLNEAGGVIKEAGRELERAGKNAGSAILDAAQRAGQVILESQGLSPASSGARRPGGFDAFAKRIRWQESRDRQFDRNGRPLTSSAGAIGAMQVLPETGERAARRAGIPWDPQRFRHDKAYNEQIGRAELARLMAKYDGNEVLAAAAYNAGEGRLDGPYRGRNGKMQTGWLERFGDPRKGEISDAEFAARIPFDETRNYVKNTAALGAGQQGPAKAEVTINLKGVPQGASTTVRGGRDVEVAVNVARSLEGP